jgi:hypothetical protein
VESFRNTLAAVPAWHHWATSQGFFHPVGSIEPEAGDIALFNRVYDANPLDHIGVVLDTGAEGIVSAEGNHSNRTGIFRNSFSVIEGYVRLPDDA